MGIVSKLFPNRDDAATARKASAQTDWIDLSDYAANEKVGDSGATTWIRFAEIRQLDDLKQFATLVYDGSLLVLDFRPVQQDEITLRRLTNELRKLAQDTGGDLAGLGDHHILITPAGVKVDRNKLSTKEAAQNENGPVSMPRTSAASPPAPAPSGFPAPASVDAGNRTTGRRTNGISR